MGAHRRRSAARGRRIIRKSLLNRMLGGGAHEIAARYPCLPSCGGGDRDRARHGRRPISWESESEALRDGSCLVADFV